MLETASIYRKKPFEEMVSPLTLPSMPPMGMRGRSKTDSNVAKKWTRKESTPGELRCIIDSEMLKRNVETKTFFEDEDVRINGSVFARRADFDNLRSIIPLAKFNGIHVKMEDDCPQGGDDVRLCLLKTLGAHDLRKVPCVGCLETLTVYDRYPLIDGTFFLSSIPRRGVPSVHLLFDSRPYLIQALCVRCLWSDWRCLNCNQEGWFCGRSLILGTLYTYDVVSAGQCCQPSCNACGTPLMIPPQYINQIKNGHHALLHEPITCSACGTTEEHLSRRINEVYITPPIQSLASPRLNPELISMEATVQ